jgi:hypothetical protein
VDRVKELTRIHKDLECVLLEKGLIHSSVEQA